MDKAIIFNQVNKFYGDFQALKSVSFEINAGSIHGLLGPNGAGKSTTMKIISGAMEHDSGEFYLLGQKIEEQTAFQKKFVGLLPENPPLYKNMTVEKFLKFILEINSDCGGKEADRKVDEVLNLCFLKEVRKKLIGELSKGYKQRVGMAQAIIYRPPVIVLDEPTSGLDPHAIHDVRELLKSLSVEHTILLSTHQLHEAHLLCSHVTILNQGEVRQTGKLEELRSCYTDRTAVKTILSYWSEEISRELQRALKVQAIEEVNKDGQAHVTFLSDKDVRELLAKELVNRNCGLLEYREEQPSLEDIFRFSTEEDRSAKELH